MGRGRPPLDADDPSTEVCVTIPSKEYDYLYERSRVERVTVPEIIRRDLREKKAERTNAKLWK